MGLPTALKSYINKGFDEKIRKIEDEMSKEISKKVTEHNTKEYKRGREFCNTLLPQLKVIIEAIDNAGFDKRIYINKPEDMFYVKSFTSEQRLEIAKPFQDKIDKLNKDRNKLLVKLSLEKDFERINQILGEYNIEL